jgi:hypothetical protein
VLRTYLDLPDWLLNTDSATKTPQQRGMDMAMASNDRRSSSPAIHCGGSKFCNVFVDVVRFIATNSKLCIWSLEDVQNADTESAELIHHLVTAKIPIVLMSLHFYTYPLLPNLCLLSTQHMSICAVPLSEVTGFWRIRVLARGETDGHMPLTSSSLIYRLLKSLLDSRSYASGGCLVLNMILTAPLQATWRYTNPAASVHRGTDCRIRCRNPSSRS